jgi:protein-disulfide isomerase/uncharacterized membrane protein
MNRESSKGAWWGACFVTLVGIGASLYLSTEHFKVLKSGALGGESFCNINPYINCDAVLLSRFSEIGTLPLAGLGLLFYLYLMGALIYSRVEPQKSNNTLTFPYLFIIFAVGMSLGLAYISLWEIRALCIFCSTLYVVNLALLFLVKKVMDMKLGEWLKNFGKVSWIKSLGYFLIVFGVGSILLHTTHDQYAREIPKDKLTLYLDAYFQQPVQPLDIQGRPFFGNPDAKIVVVEFSDFECPYCKKAAGTLLPILSQYRDQVKLVFMNYPLDMSCNKELQRPLHTRSCAAAAAAYCAGRQGKFWEYHDKTFARQPKYQPASLLNIAEKLKLDLNQFKACLTSEQTDQAIQADLQQGNAAKVQGTPTVFVNGRHFQPWISREAWEMLIDRLAKGQVTPLHPLPAPAAKPSPAPTPPPPNS